MLAGRIYPPTDRTWPAATGNAWPAGGARHSRRSSVHTTASCSGSGTLAQRHPRHAPPKQQRDGVIEDVLGIHGDRAAAVPAAQGVRLVHGLGVQPAGLEN